MGRTKQQVVTEFRCSEILEAARKLFSKRGYGDVTIDEIAAAAGLAKATVYQYFASKQEIYLGALRAGVYELLERTDAQVNAAESVRAKVEAFIRTRLEYLQEHHEFFAVYHAEFGNLTHAATLNQEFRSIYRRQFERLQRILEEGIANGELAAVSAETLAIAIYESTKGVILHRSLGWSAASVDEQVEALMRILWGGAGKKESRHR